jgi:hypothetical protein
MILYPPLLKRGITLAPSLIFIPSWARHDSAYLAHEQTHAAQQREIGTLRFWWLYIRSAAFRLGVEVEAYKAQIAAGTPLGHCAYWLATGYGLGLTIKKANELLRRADE